MYYPLSKITPNLYTSGGDFTLKDTQNNYKGYYYSTYDGRFFTEKLPNSNSRELLKSFDQSKLAPTLSSIVYNRTSTPNIPTPAAISNYIPAPTDSDYTNGYITRYFSQRVNGDASTLKELNTTDYNALATNVLYRQTLLQWKISGALDDTVVNGGMVVPGIVTFNQNSIYSASKIIPSIYQYLTNLTQFSK